MVDTRTPEQRSKIMGRIGSKDTKPEMLVRKLVFGLGYRYRLHDKKLPGRPDLVFKSKKKAIFVHGCFWHQHRGCKRGKPPKSNLYFWKAKLEKNKLRDQNSLRQLEKLGWKTLVIWECETKNVNTIVNILEAFLRQPERSQ